MGRLKSEIHALMEGHHIVTLYTDKRQALYDLHILMEDLRGDEDGEFPDYWLKTMPVDTSTLNDEV